MDNNMNDTKQNLYSRQIGTFGKDTMNKITNLKVQIIGDNYTSLELTKCLCLMGIGEITINMDTKLSYDSNSTLKYIKSLNEYVTITIDNSLQKTVDIIIVTDILKYNTIKISKFCRENNIKFILGLCVGFTGLVFVDFIKHTVLDATGEKQNFSYVKGIEEEGTRTKWILSEDNEFSTGDSFKLNGTVYTFINMDKNIGYTAVFKGDCPKFIKEHNEPINIEHITLEEYIDKNIYPSSSINIFNNGDIILRDMRNIIKNPKYINRDEWESEYVINNGYPFPIISNIIGSIISQEVIKITGKYTPLSQDFLIDYSELYDKKSPNLYKTVIDRRYINIYKLLDKQTIKSLQKQNIFLVGCGALGSEYLKYFSLLNMATKKYSKITVTDMDTIELSNLNRQFLFRNSDIGKNKSDIATEKIKEINPNINTTSLTKQVCKDSEDYFNRIFWEKQDIVVNALDNITARKYVDTQCVLYNKPLFEAGTLGTKSNVQVIIPNVTQTYSDTSDPPDKDIPICTLKSFPYKPEHCVDWALSHFNELFNDLIIDVKALLGNRLNAHLEIFNNENIARSKTTQLKNIYPYLISLEKRHLINFVISIYEDIFIDNVRQVLHDYPDEHLDDTGTKFWTGNKLKPKLLTIQNNIDLCDFTYLVSIIINRCLNIKLTIEKDEIDYIIKEYTRPTCDDIEFNLNEFLISDIKTEHFDKDIDDNQHLQLIMTISNIRAQIYGIDTLDYLGIKLISGRIIPAIASTTALITGIGTMELIKYIKFGKDITQRDHYSNMGLNMYISSDVQKAKPIISGMYSELYGCNIRAVPEKITTWDRILIKRYRNRVFTVKEIIVYIKKKIKYSPDIVSCDTIVLYNKHAKSSFDLDIDIEELYKMLNLETSSYIEFIYISHDNIGRPVITPKILYKFDV